jgi:hypothetical protein
MLNLEQAERGLRDTLPRGLLSGNFSPEVLAEEGAPFVLAAQEAAVRECVAHLLDQAKSLQEIATKLNALLGRTGQGLTPLEFAALRANVHLLQTEADAILALLPPKAQEKPAEQENGE